MDNLVYQIEESKLGTAYQAYCPALVMTGFGETSEDAKDALRREISIYLEACEAMGILDEVLIEAGFYDNDEVWMSSQGGLPKEPKITII